MKYYEKNLWILAGFNLIVSVGRITSILIDDTGIREKVNRLAEIRTLALLVMSVLLVLIARNQIKLGRALKIAYVILGIYVWLAFDHYAIRYDTIVNAGLMILGFSTISVHQYYSEEKHWEKIREREAQTLDLRISEPGQLFHPMVIGPHLEINQEVVGAVEYFVGRLKEITPLEVDIYCGGIVSEHLQETAEEAFREHFVDEERRLLRILRNRSRRSMLLFCISMTIIFVWSYYDAVAGQSVIWTVLGNMGGFFLWEIGNTHFRHADDYLELERILVCRDAVITFI